jgi:hypothetical protein
VGNERRLVIGGDSTPASHLQPAPFPLYSPKPSMEDHSALTALNVTLIFGLTACVGMEERPLPPDHPANPLAAPAPRQPPRYALETDAESARTRQLLDDAARRGQPQPQEKRDQGSAMNQQEMPAMVPGRDRP